MFNTIKKKIKDKIWNNNYLYMIGKSLKKTNKMLNALRIKKIIYILFQTCISLKLTSVPIVKNSHFLALSVVIF